MEGKAGHIVNMDYPESGACATMACVRLRANICIYTYIFSCTHRCIGMDAHVYGCIGICTTACAPQGVAVRACKC